MSLSLRQLSLQCMSPRRGFLVQQRFFPTFASSSRFGSTCLVVLLPSRRANPTKLSSPFMAYKPVLSKLSDFFLAPEGAPCSGCISCFVPVSCVFCFLSGYPLRNIHVPAIASASSQTLSDLLFSSTRTREGSWLSSGEARPGVHVLL